jgi:hypothetical protein
MPFATDDWMNAVEEQTVNAYKEDADLGSGGDLAITTWPEELPDNFNQYPEVELPVLITVCQNVTVDHNDEAGIPDGQIINFFVDTFVILSAAAQLERDQTAKEHLARVVRVLIQQYKSGKNLSDLPSALDWADSGGVLGVDILSATWEQGDAQSNFRVVGTVEAVVSVSFQITGD